MSVDAENRFYWRMNPIRMEAQTVRDAMLKLSGELESKMGGPSLDPVIQEMSRRRSLYFVHSHNDHHKFLSIFDDANVLECYRREQSIVPQQALALSNSKQAFEAATKIAEKVAGNLQDSSDASFVKAVFIAVLAAEPTAEEQAACDEAMTAWKDVVKAEKGIDPQRQSRINLIHALLNHNDFVTIR